MTHKRNRNGFTLIEILIVLALLSLIATIFGGKIIGALTSGQRKATALQIKQLEGSLDRYRLDCGSYPTTDQGLEALVAAPSAGKQCKDYDPEGYLNGKKKVPQDPWNNPFKYECADGLHYKITSFGKDGIEGGDGNAQDITSDEEK